MIEDKEQGLFFMEQLVEIHTNDELMPVDKYTNQLKSLLDELSKQGTSTISVDFSNTFARLTYLFQQFKIEKELQQQVHYFRIQSRKVKKKLLRSESLEHIFSLQKYNLAIVSIARLIHHLYNVSISQEFSKLVNEFEEKQQLVEEKNDTLAVYEKMRVVMTRKEENKLWCRDEENLFLDEIEVDCSHIDIRWFWDNAQLLLLNCKTSDNKIYRPSTIILAPDYLIDVSGVADCFKDIKGNTSAEGFAIFYFIKRFLPNVRSRAIFMGNIVNHLFDEQVNDFENADFKELFTKTFKKYPLEYVTIPDMGMEFLEEAQNHFNTLKTVLTEDFPTIGIDNLSQAITEPSFISADYGLQGRLDLLTEQNDKINIVELKSGKLFSYRPNGINLHYHAQALLYKYLISNGFEGKIDDINTYILYSRPLNKPNTITGFEHKQLRYATPYKELESQLFNVRNRIVALDYKLANANLEELHHIFTSLSLKNLELKSQVTFPHFYHRDFQEIQETLHHANNLERTYFYLFAQFISKEQFLAKLGSPTLETDRGFARLWQSDFPMNMDDSIIEGLTIESEECIKINQSVKTVSFERPFQDKEVNFRQGDLCIVYASDSEKDFVTNQQNFKGYIEEINKEQVVIRFRNRQSKTLFLQKKQWTIVPDFMEVGFQSMYKNIYAFLGQTNEKKKLWFGLTKPNVKDQIYDEEITRLEGENLNKEQENIIRKMMQAEDYFLLVGPPGTGKTSTVLKHLVRELYKDEKKNVLVLAYTNRAVDEISEAIDDAIGHIPKITPQHFIRIGSELSTAEKYRPNLLNNLPFNNRRELVPMIQEHRVFVSTIATFSNRQDILELKDFDTVIIDEASQILEPQIIGILCLFKKVILIGDEKQLPAISVQDDSFANLLDTPKTNELSLLDIGLTNLKNSLFERMLATCKKQKWTDVYDTLTTQYRMHHEIADFPNITFYQANLKVGTAPHQLEKTLYSNIDEENFLQQKIANNRFLFFPSKVNKKDTSLKVNSYEAELVSQLIQEVITLYKVNNQVFDPQKTIGVITPFRSQISQIKKQLENDKIPNFDKIIVDTVERFQGSQRDIIILSLCMNSSHQVRNLTNYVEVEEEVNCEKIAVDRKLNVALTRARKQQFIIGNDRLLANEMIYFQLIEYAKSNNNFVNVSIDKLIGKETLIDSTLFFDTAVHTPSTDFKKFYQHFIEVPLNLSLIHI